MERRRNHSKKRDAILETIRSTKSHPSAEWVFEQLREDFPNLSLGTVYRNIAEFKESGEVMSVAVVDGIDRIDGDTSPHEHLVCTACGAVEDLELDLQTEAISKQISERCGAQASRIHLTAYGLCRCCLKKTN
ncbi:MAG: transcriptional repressor [Oscillospiraceae bacterium]|nr:transcriptional repressor [Oscillospiraceae bacterium]